MATRSSKTGTTTTRKTTTTKTTAATASKAKKLTTAKTSVTAAAKATVEPQASDTSTAPVVSRLQPVVSGPTMRKRELVEAVVKKSGVKKKDAKPVVEAMLAILGSALQDGRELNLQPLGKIKINRERKRPEGKVMIAKIRQAKDLPTSEVSAPKADSVSDVAVSTDTPTAAE